MAAAAVGLASIGAGAYLWFSGGVAHRGVAVAPAVGDGRAGLVVVGGF